MGKAETTIEQHFCNEIKRLGGFTRKFRSPGQRGVPDRVVFLHQAFFAELKTPMGKLSKLQQLEIARMREHGAFVVVLASMTEVDEFIAGYEKILARRFDNAESNVV